MGSVDGTIEDFVIKLVDGGKNEIGFIEPFNVLSLSVSMTNDRRGQISHN